MTISFRQLVISMALLGLLANALHAQAGTARTVDAEGNQASYEFQDNKLRINMPENPDSYMVMRDANVYIVSDRDGQPMVIDASAAWKVASGMIDLSSQDFMAGEVVSLKSAGRKETHAGIQGDVYDLVIKDSKGKEEKTEIVLSSDPKALAFSNAMKTFAESAAKAMGKELEAGARDMQRELDKLNKGILRVGNDMKLVAVSGELVDPNRFALPAAPMKMPSFGSFSFPTMGGDNSDDGGENGEETPAMPSMKELGKAIGNIFGN